MLIQTQMMERKENSIPSPMSPGGLPLIIVNSENASIEKIRTIDWDEYAEHPNRHWWPSNEFLRFLPKIPYGGRVLDAGCGTGNHLWALEFEDRNGIGIDVAWKALTGARAYLEKQRCYDVPLVQASMTLLPFHAQTFDAVIDVLCSQHLSSSERVQAYREIARVLKAGARFYLYCWYHGDAEHLYAGRHPELDYISTRRLNDILEQAGLRVDPQCSGSFSRGLLAPCAAGFMTSWHFVQAVKP